MFYRPLTRSSLPADVLSALKGLPPNALPRDCHSWENVRSGLRLFLRESVETIRAERPIEPAEIGRGIVTCGGGAKYFPSIYAMLRRLVDLDCRLPVEVWHLGIREMDPTMKRLMTTFGVRVVDAEALSRALPWRILNGWELKLFAMLYSDLREVLFLDADCTPVRDPTYLFESAGYREHGCVLWPDYTNWTLHPWVWRAFDLTPPPDHLGGVELVPRDRASEAYALPMPPGYDPPIESGQVLVDKGRCRAELRLAGLLCEYSDITFHYVHGDKEMFRLAWRLFDRRYALPKRFPGWDTHTILQHCPENDDVLFHHRVQDKLRVRAAGNRRGAALENEQDLLRYVTDLDALWAGVPWQNDRPTPVEAALTRRIAGATFTYRVPGGQQSMVLAEGGRITTGSARLERRWALYVEDGHPLIAIQGDDGLLAILHLAEDGAWRGRWLLHERHDVELALAEPPSTVASVSNGKAVLISQVVEPKSIEATSP